MADRDRYRSISTGNWPAMAEMLMGPILTPSDRERRRIEALELARALLTMAGERDLAAQIPLSKV